MSANRRRKTGSKAASCAGRIVKVMAGLRSSPRGTYSDRGEDSVLQEVYRFPVNGGELGEHLSSKWQKTRRPIPDVAVVRLEDGGPEAQPVRDGPQETVPEPVLGPLSR